MFGGRWDPALLTGWHRLLRRMPASPLRVLPAADLRDWAAIDRWAAVIEKKTRSRFAQPGSSPSARDSGSRAGASLSAIGEYVNDQQREPLHRTTTDTPRKEKEQ